MQPLTKFKFKMKPYAHQLREFVQTKDTPFHALLWDMRTGKTKVVMDKAQYLFERGEIDVLVMIAPNGVHRDHIIDQVPQHVKHEGLFAYWVASPRKAEREALDRLADPTNRAFKIVTFNTDAIRFKKKEKNRGFTFLESLLKSHRALVAVDESSDFKNMKSQRVAGLLQLRDLSKYRVIMDGTPVTNGPCDLFAPFEFLSPGLLGYTSFTAFQARYEVLVNPSIKFDFFKVLVKSPQGRLRDEEKFFVDLLYQMKTRNEPLTADIVRGTLPTRLHRMTGAILSTYHRSAVYKVAYKNIDELNAKIAPYSTRVLKRDVFDIPPLTEKKIYFDLPAKVKAIYKKLVKDLITQVETEQVTALNVLTLYIRLQQIVGGWYTPDPSPTDPEPEPKKIPGDNARFKLLQRYIKKIDDREKIIIWCKFVPEIEELLKVLRKEYGKHAVVDYYGGTPPVQRDVNKKFFREDPDCRFFVGNADIGGYGLDLSSADYMFFYSRSFKLRTNNQAAERFISGSKKTSSTVISIIANDSIDVRVFEALQNKQDIADYITGDFLRLLK